MKTRLLAYLVGLALALGYAQWRVHVNAPLDVAVVDAGRVRVDGKLVDIAALPQQIASQVRGRERVTARVSVAASSSSETLIPVLDALHAGGVTDVQVVAEP